MNLERLERDAALRRSDPVYGRPTDQLKTLNDAISGQCADVLACLTEERKLDEPRSFGETDSSDSDGDIRCRPKGPSDAPMPRTPVLGLAA